MRSSESFEGLEVWQRSMALAVDVCKAAAHCKDWGFRDQITRSAVSVPSNLAEGAERNGPKEFVQFIGIAKGSLGELRTQIMIGQELGYFDQEVAGDWLEEGRQIARMLHALMQSLTRDH
ncbi:four helix bundle protein [Sulfuriroseicoccus oceanibius]|uniref:Four helix bundle protein n=1 Tax=Sulfuriroseicoccus oceanibius TaxID=2707525 RepID=A0A6B3L2S7_9BACT|nr:four helix bundle protein [Sulfuriroseicoccus oceanibius]QQL44307.1 four helix bundle protein [Sulfuriroseicoccus oceanibius]